VPSDEHATDTVRVTPDEPDGVNTHPVAVPVLEKSPAATPVTLLLNTSVYDNVRDDDGDDGSVHDTVGASVSIVTDEALTPDTGPVIPDAVTALAAIRATTVPSDEHATDTVILEPEELDGVNTHPDAVPVLEKSPAATPVTLLLNTSV
jgi:SH3-like domain-containing protein